MSAPFRMMRAVTVRAPAKINLALAVGPMRPDGFHDLASVYQAIDLADEVTATPARDITVTVSGKEAPLVPRDGTNLAVRAARLLARRYDVREGIALHLAKSIPVAGGLAGGSSDAAAALLACNALWGTGLDQPELLDLARELGSDVPFCLLGGTVLGSGRGEVVTPVSTLGSYPWVLALSTPGLSTPEVYAELDQLRAGTLVPPPKVSGSLLAALRTGDVSGVGASLTNDLQPAALRLRPSLAPVLAAGRDHGALGTVVSGSGPTCLFLGRGEGHAAELAAKLRTTGLCSAVREARGPVPTAQRDSVDPMGSVP